MSDSEVQEKKSRGRPKKTEGEKTASPAVKKSKVAAESSAKRGRGRPKGSISKKKKASPKKAAAAGKKRGRKPKAAKEESDNAEDNDE
ncbi:high mobility group protein I [Galendromus occidentalis]|uniref:High mobility group protein I n=1 Tax=Galendromus occidentalis TaxID=34638 RepID=A0AAJ7L709_9ACAR|nr:high mobility group protein I [Galendromus occidentalis]